jgi:DNA-binding NarL/FixJ family response regulator
VIRVLLADDHPMFRYGLRAALGSDPDIALVGEASTGEQAVDLARELEPDVVVMDLTMPGFGGIEATRRIVAHRPAARVLVVTMFEDSASVIAAVRAGVRGYLVKGADRDELLRAVRAAAAGETILGAAAAQHVAYQLAAPPAPQEERILGLTAREQEILELIAAGLTNAAITQRLGLSPKTVRNYTSTVFGKLGVETRADAIARARSAGLG